MAFSTRNIVNVFHKENNIELPLPAGNKIIRVSLLSFKDCVDSWRVAQNPIIVTHAVNT